MMVMACLNSRDAKKISAAQFSLSNSSTYYFPPPSHPPTLSPFIFLDFFPPLLLVSFEFLLEGFN